MTIYLIRHAQSQFNAVYDPDQPDPMIFDAPLSELGHIQGTETRHRISEIEIHRVIVSPLTRTLQTALLLFGPTRNFEINAVVREQLLNSCDVGRSPPQLATDYPLFDFDHLDDVWWHNDTPDHRGFSVEPDQVLQERAAEFKEFLRDTGAHNTAVVTHGNFIRALTGIKPDNCQIIEFDPH
ncbi:MAG: histidine phosphatase family protein [Pseudomonadota bacterium]